MGHQLYADVQVEIGDDVPVGEANRIASSLKQQMRAHLPSLRRVNITFGPAEDGMVDTENLEAHGHHHAPDPFHFTAESAEGVLEIVDTDAGERMRLSLTRAVEGLSATVIIQRECGILEELPLNAMTVDRRVLQSSVAPAEPHDFAAELLLLTGKHQEKLPFRMFEPAGHHH